MHRLLKSTTTWAAANPVTSTLLLTALLTLLLYARALTAGFAPYDDPIQIVGNPAIRSLSASLIYLHTHRGLPSQTSLMQQKLSPVPSCRADPPLHLH